MLLNPLPVSLWTVRLLGHVLFRFTPLPQAPIRTVALTRRGGISLELLIFPSRPASSHRRSATVMNSHYISTESLAGEELSGLWDQIALTPQEELVLRALRFVDPKIERIASVGSHVYSSPGRSGFIVKRSDYAHPFPIGSLGDGAWRMLAMAIAVTQCNNGVLLVDEIDTGLHFTVLADMWKLILATARELNVQVFATTHSYDCVQSSSLLSVVRTYRQIVRSQSNVLRWPKSRPRHLENQRF